MTAGSTATGRIEHLRSDRVRSQLELVLRLARRNIAQRYRDTAFGAIWSLINPLVLLLIYWVVFSQIFESRWTGEGEDRAYALLIFSGIIFFTLFADIIVGATTLVQTNAQLIKRTQVSAKVLPLSAALAALFTFGLNFVPFVAMYLLLDGIPPWTILLLPMALVPLLVLTTALGLFVAGTAAYVRDLQQIVPLSTTAVLFLSPVFFSLDRIPSAMASVVRVLSPLGVVLPASKDLIFFGRIPPLVPLGAYSLTAAALFAAGWWFYGLAAKGFGDVV